MFKTPCPRYPNWKMKCTQGGATKTQRGQRVKSNFGGGHNNLCCEEIADWLYINQMFKKSSYD